MDQSEVSIQEVRFFSALKSDTSWRTSKELAAAADIGPSSARAYALKWARRGILETAVVFPGYRYRLAAKASEIDGAYIVRLERAVEAFGRVPP